MEKIFYNSHALRSLRLWIAVLPSKALLSSPSMEFV
jgi:hypothetical protein